MGKKQQPALETAWFDLPAGGVITVLPTESEDDLHQLIDSLNEQNKPDGDAEQFLVDQMIHARWRVLRFRRLEAVALDRAMENQFGSPSADRRVLREIETPGNALDKLDRYIAAAERAYSKAVRDLAQLRAHAATPKKSEKQNKAKAADLWLQSELAKIPMRVDPWIFPPRRDSSVQNEPNDGDTTCPAHPAIE